jgi:exoribonuclease-2
VVLNDKVVDVVTQEKNRATELIEDFMIAANEVVARMMETNKVSSIRRVVKTPERWGRIVELAAKQGGSNFPPNPIPKRSMSFCSSVKLLTPITLSIFRWRSSS